MFLTRSIVKYVGSLTNNIDGIANVLDKFCALSFDLIAFYYLSQMKRTIFNGFVEGK